MMAYEGFESAWDNFGKFIHQFQPETKTLLRKLERILNKLYKQNLSLLFNETRLYIYIYIYIHKPIRTCKIVWVCLVITCFFLLRFMKEVVLIRTEWPAEM